MVRLAGILIGSTLAVGLLVILLGSPRLAATDPHAEADSPGSGSVSYPAGSGSVTEHPTDAQLTDSAILSGLDRPDMEIVSDSEPGSLETDPELAAAMVEQVFSPEAERETILPVAPEPVEERWYAFWSPFRSEIAANGFVSKLQDSTGINYRVVKVKTGVYEVAFAYSEDADIQEKLERISSATGLDVSGS